MFNYTACTRPLCGVLVARGLTIAVALLVGPAMADHSQCNSFCMKYDSTELNKRMCEKNKENDLFVMKHPFGTREDVVLQAGGSKKDASNIIKKILNLKS